MAHFAVALFGPTGIGKTALSLRLAKEKGEIISVDSMQVYRYMDIGTAKAAPDQLASVPHHLIDCITPDIQFTAGEFKRYCEKMIPEIFLRGKVPFLVGGTGFYFSTLMRGIVNIPQIEEGLKERVRKLALKRNQEHLYRMLELVDPEMVQRINRRDAQRTQRVLEVFFGTGRQLSGYYKEERISSPVDYLKIGLTCDRALLYERINKRVDAMLEAGLVDEVKSLLERGFCRTDPGMSAIGYKEVLEYLDGKISLDQAIDEIKKNTRHYAKRQLTWFRSIDDVLWFDVADEEKVIATVNTYLERKSNDLCTDNR